eukprot:scaffold36200_cov63-Phaeocystis_antarctica.AAC.14
MSTFCSTAAQVRSCCRRLIAPVAPGIGGARSAARSAAAAAGLRGAELVAESSTLPRLSTDWLARRLTVSKTPGAARVAVVALTLARLPATAVRGGEAAAMTAGVSSVPASSPSATCATSSEQQAIAAAWRTSTCSESRKIEAQRCANSSTCASMPRHSPPPKLPRVVSASARVDTSPMFVPCMCSVGEALRSGSACATAVSAWVEEATCSCTESCSHSLKLLCFGASVVVSRSSSRACSAGSREGMWSAMLCSAWTSAGESGQLKRNGMSSSQKDPSSGPSASASLARQTNASTQPPLALRPLRPPRLSRTSLRIAGSSGVRGLLDSARAQAEMAVAHSTMAVGLPPTRPVLMAMLRPCSRHAAPELETTDEPRRSRTMQIEPRKSTNHAGRTTHVDVPAAQSVSEGEEPIARPSPPPPLPAACGVEARRAEASCRSARLAVGAPPEGEYCGECSKLGGAAKVLQTRSRGCGSNAPGSPLA